MARLRMISVQLSPHMPIKRITIEDFRLGTKHELTLYPSVTAGSWPV